MERKDTTLMELVKQGDHLAFQELVERHKLSVLNLCYKFTNNSTDAEDLAQDVFVRIFQAAKRYEPKASFTTWMYRIAANRCLNFQRRKKLLSFFSIDQNNHNKDSHEYKVPELSTTDRPDEDFEKKERQKLVQKAIRALPESQRMVVILYRYHELSYKEISNVLQISVSAVESRLHRAKHNLKNHLAPLLKEDIRRGS